MAKIELSVHGRVGGSGSKTVFKTKSADGSVKFNTTPASKFQAPWQQSVKWAFLKKYSTNFMPIAGPVVFNVVFYKSRPDGHFKKNGEFSKEGLRHPYPDKRQEPDVDKAVRATGDALTGLAYRDDKLVVDLHAKWRWREQPGAEIVIETLNNEEDSGTERPLPLR